MKRLPVLAFAIVAACGGQATAPDDGPTSVDVPPAEAPPSTPEVSQPDATVVPGEDAADTFDSSFLVEGPGSQFVVLDDPVMVPAASAEWLLPDDIVLGVVPGDDQPQAFPIRQMAYHHIANTTVAGEPYLVTY